jgi:hypothetical protein
MMENYRYLLNAAYEAVEDARTEIGLATGWIEVLSGLAPSRVPVVRDHATAGQARDALSALHRGLADVSSLSWTVPVVRAAAEHCARVVRHGVPSAPEASDGSDEWLTPGVARRGGPDYTAEDLLREDLAAWAEREADRDVLFPPAPLVPRELRPTARPQRVAS